MKTKSHKPFIVLAPLLALTLNQPLSIAFAQGSLTPPGAPAPTMKALSQIEPRTDVFTLSGNGNNQYLITQGGAYYLTTNIVGVASKNGINIQADNVTLDLEGFTLFGGVTNSQQAILVNGAHVGLVIRNGTVSGWGGNGITAGSVSESEFSHLRSLSNGGVGLKVASGNTIANCTMEGNSGDGIDTTFNCKLVNCNLDGNMNGISAGNGCTMDHCVANNNSSYGVLGGQNCTILGCLVVTNVGGIHIGSGGIVSDCNINWDSSGLYIGNGSTITGCTANNNVSGGITTGDNCRIGQSVTLADAFGGIIAGNGCTVHDCIESGSFDDDGIYVGQNCNVTGCSANDNYNGGISSGNNCTIVNCTADDNEFGIGTASGCTITSCIANTNVADGIDTIDSCTIKDCVAYQNTFYGFSTGNGCTLSGCTASANTFGFDLESECTIDHCSANANDTYGIYVEYSCLVLDNTIASNSRYVNNQGAGIYAASSGNRIEGNNSNTDYIGIQVPGSENIVIKNTVRGALNENYFIVGDNMTGPVVNATPEGGGIVGSSGGIGLGSTDPWANFSF